MSLLLLYDVGFMVLSLPIELELRKSVFGDSSKNLSCLIPLPLHKKYMNMVIVATNYFFKFYSLSRTVIPDDADDWP